MDEFVFAIAALIILALLIPSPSAEKVAVEPEILKEIFGDEDRDVSELVGHVYRVSGDEDVAVGQICPLVPGNDEPIEALKALNIVAIDSVDVVEDSAAVEVVYQPVAVGNQVDELFDRAWSEGVKTYTGLIEYVRTATGKGTSKTRVKTWKVQRGYVDA